MSHQCCQSDKAPSCSCPGSSGTGECNCGSSCTCSHCQHKKGHQHEDFSQQLLKLADDAWMEVLKEKIKEQIKTVNGSQLDQLAKLVAGANNERWKNKMGSHKVSRDFHQKINDFFHS